MNTFDKRANYGEAAVIKVCKILQEKSIQYKTTREHFGAEWSPLIDSIYGDLILFFNDTYYYIDVKRNSISETSIKNFKGKGYFLYHHFLSKNMFVSTEFLKSIYKKNENLLESLQSGDPGIKYKSLYKYNLPTIENFLDELLYKNSNNLKI